MDTITSNKHAGTRYITIPIKTSRETPVSINRATIIEANMSRRTKDNDTFVTVSTSNIFFISSPLAKKDSNDIAIRT